MFADDVGLLPDQMFTRMLRQARHAPDNFADLAGDLFRVMSSRRAGSASRRSTGSTAGCSTMTQRCRWRRRTSRRCLRRQTSIGRRSIRRSSGLCSNAGWIRISAPSSGRTTPTTTRSCWIVEPVVIRPWLSEWAAEKAEIAAKLEQSGKPPSHPPARTKRRNDAERRYRTFLNRLRRFTVLDPACGSGNFLYLALHALHDVEHQVQLEAEALGLQRGFPLGRPSQREGDRIERLRGRTGAGVGVDRRDPVDAEERVSGRAGSRSSTRWRRSSAATAILTADGGEPEWPEADVVIGNPPFLGGKLLISNLGEEYVSTLFRVYERRGAPRGRSGLLLVREGR